MQRSHDRKRVLLYSGSSMYTVWKKEKQVNENKRNRWMGTRRLEKTAGTIEYKVWLASQ